MVFQAESTARLLVVLTLLCLAAAKSTVLDRTRYGTVHEGKATNENQSTCTYEKIRVRKEW